MTDLAQTAWLIPEGLSLLSSILLIATSFITAVITATLGVGGGVLLLAVMASLMPAIAIIPVHGLVQAGANANRALLTARHIDRSLLINFALGAGAGAVLASFVVIQLPVETIQLSIALFVIYLTWGPGLQAHYLSGWSLRAAAAITTLISMFVGASGPLVAAFVQQISEDRYIRVATFSACMATQHGIKLLVFGWLGFAFSDWLGLIILMIISGYAGTRLGLSVLSRLNNRIFNYAFRIVLSVLAFRLLVDASLSLLG